MDTIIFYFHCATRFSACSYGQRPGNGSKASVHFDMGHYKTPRGTGLQNDLKILFHLALTGMAQLVGHHSANQRATSSIPGWGTRLGCRSVPGQGAYKKQRTDVSFSHQCFSFSLYPSFLLSLKINNFFQSLFHLIISLLTIS